MEKTKNCWVIPTDKPSRLYKNLLTDKLFILENSFMDVSECNREFKNIYITSDEEIKEYDYFLNTLNNSVLTNLSIINSKHLKKIILTTDQDLIKNGVQAIDDEFLEWFVKNPSCDFVKTEEYISYGVDNWKYLITIPKEEPKQETIEEAAKQAFEAQCFGGLDINPFALGYFIAGAKWQQEQDNKVIQNLKDRLDMVRHTNIEIIKAVEKFKKK